MPILKQVDKTFFKKWTSEMAYILGFFAADGYITHNKRGAYFFCIEIIDKDLLYSIRKTLGSNHKISVRKGFKNVKDSYRLQIGSFEMCHDLFKLGFTTNKTKSMSVPRIPERFFPDFLRGYFDGDGNVWVGKIHKKRKKPSLVTFLVLTSCSSNFLNSLLLRLRKLGIKGGSLYNIKSSYSRLQFSTGDAWKICDIMYNHSDLMRSKLFLKRKKKVFDKYAKLKQLRP